MRVVEHRRHIRRKCQPSWIDVGQIHNLRGFRSVYEYDYELVKDFDTTRYLNSLPAYSDTLFVDFDNAREAADGYWRQLQADNISATKWDSGNRSIHLHIDIKPMYGELVPQIQKAWVKANMPEADNSYLQSAGMFRLPGTFHSKNPGHMKHMLDSIESDNRLTVEMPNVLPSLRKEADTIDHVRWSLRLLDMEAHEGGRTPHLFKLVYALKSSGESLDIILKEALFWNKNYAYPPHPDQYIANKVYEIFNTY